MSKLHRLFPNPVCSVLLLATSVSLSAGFGSPSVYADADGVSVARVEEDWELILFEPSSSKNCPQFETVMGTQEDLCGPYARVTWNYREFPNFVGAGLQVQEWYCEQKVQHRSVNENSLSNVAETITWTQVLDATNPCHVKFLIANGHSNSWGNFGGGTTEIQLQQDCLNLNRYTTDVSANNCRINYGLNRVGLLRIKEVRRYDRSENLLSTQTARILYQIDTSTTETED